jgi:hypothetical protein
MRLDRDFVSGSGSLRLSLQACVVPALRTEREGRGTQFIASASESESLGHPPSRLPLDKNEGVVKDKDILSSAGHRFFRQRG